MSLTEAGEDDSLIARLAFEADLEGSPSPQENGGAATPQRQSECSEDQPDLDDEVSTYEVLLFFVFHILYIFPRNLRRLGWYLLSFFVKLFSVLLCCCIVPGNAYNSSSGVVERNKLISFKYRVVDFQASMNPTNTHITAVQQQQ